MINRMLLISCLAAAACSSPPQVDSKASAATNQCVPQGSRCKLNGTACCTGFCTDDGYGYGYGNYGWGTCSAPQPTGSYCQNDAWCQSGKCDLTNYMCAPDTSTSCVSPGNGCTKDDQCCAGTFCDNQTYGPWHCTAPRADGAFCNGDSQCQSGKCWDYKCVPATCSDNGVTCFNNDACCSGVCHIAYIKGTCGGALPAGSWCGENRECASNVCDNYSCK